MPDTKSVLAVDLPEPLVIIGCIALIVLCLGVILYTLLRKSKYTGKTAAGDALDDLVGKRGVVTETVDIDSGTGLVEIDGEGWSARSVYIDDVYHVGDEVVVVAREGVQVIVRPVSD